MGSRQAFGGSGASGRNGTLIRGAFSSPEWTRFFAHSCHLWQGLSRRLGENVMYSRRGYSMIGERSSTAAMLDRTLEVHKACGINSSLLNAAQFVNPRRALVPVKSS